MSQYSEQVAKVVTPDLLWLRAQFQAHGYDIRIVGGAVRDLLLGLAPNDVDFCTDASQQEQFALYQKLSVDFPEFQYIATGVDHGTYTVIPTRGGEGYEITSLRTESQHDGRHAVVAYTKDWNDDLGRRDLTINAMALTFTGDLIDPFNGIFDLETLTVRFVGDADERMKEDYLRILRYFRFLGRFSSELASANTVPVQALYDSVAGLSVISAERIWVELQKIVAHPSAPWVMKLMTYHSVLDMLKLPETNDHFNQLKAQGCVDPVLLMIALLPQPVQASAVKEMAVKLKWSNEERKAAFEVAHYSHAPSTELLKMAVAVQSRDPALAIKVSEFWGDLKQMAEIAAWVVPVFPVTGADLIALGHKPGKELGNMLFSMKYSWFTTGATASKETLIAIAVQVAEGKVVL